MTDPREQARAINEAIAVAEAAEHLWFSGYERGLMDAQPSPCPTVQAVTKALGGSE